MSNCITRLSRPAAGLLVLCAISGHISAAPFPVTLGHGFTAVAPQAPASIHAPANAIDGYVTDGKQWRGNAAGSNNITLDVGSPQNLQGLYLWMRGSGNISYWVGIETSVDGVEWNTQWRAINTKKNRNREPIYLPMTRTGPAIRYVKLHGFGRFNSGARTLLMEARYLLQGETISASQHVHRAHWFNRANTNADSPGNLTQANQAPHLTAWNNNPSRYLTRWSYNYAQAEEYRCPTGDSAVFFPQSAAVDVTGQSNQFMVTKVLPDSSRVYAIDWDQADFSDISSPVTGNFPTQMGDIANDMRAERAAYGNAGLFDYSWILHCDGGAGDYHYNLPDAYNLYNAAQGGSVDPLLTEGWNNLINTAAATTGYVIPVSLGIPFSNVDGDAGEFGSLAQNTIDGFVDSGSRWSNQQDGSLVYSVGPGATFNPTVKGVYVWMHRSHQRNSSISIDARVDSGNFYNVLPETPLPIVPITQPIFIPLTAGLSDPLKHIRINGHGNSTNTWSSIAEIRYSTSTTPPAGVTVVNPVTSHLLGGNTLDSAMFQLNPGSTNGSNPVNWSIDQDASSLNYYAANGPGTLYLDMGTTESLSALNLWMHRSNERTSVINLRAWNEGYSPLQQNSITVNNFTVPMSGIFTPTQIVLPQPIAARYIEIDFSGNSNNSWNSIAEVSWN